MTTNTPLRVGIILGSTRQGRFGEQPANWILEKAKGTEGIETELIDLRDHPLPFFDEAVPPSMWNGNYPSEIIKKWNETIKSFDAFIIVAPEYNHGYSAVLKNALDYAFEGWKKKPVAFVSYGGLGGARSVEQLRQVVINLEMAPILAAVQIANYWSLLDDKGKIKTESFDDRAKPLLDELIWWGKALKSAREA